MVRRRAFTLIELLVVITVIGILIALLLPAIQASREAARRAQCTGHLKQLVLAAHNYHTALGSFPSGQYLHPYSTAARQGTPCNNAGWLVMLLPYLEQAAVHNAVNFQFMWGMRRQGAWSRYGQENATVRRTVLQVLLCPSDPSPPTDDHNADEIGTDVSAGTSYIANIGNNCLGGRGFPCVPPEVGDAPDDPRGGSGVIWRKGSARMAEVTDGLANTFLCCEQVMAATDWNSWVHANESVGSTAIPLNHQPPDASREIEWFWTYSFRSRHPGGASFGLCDGSVRFVRDTISLATYQALSTRAGSEPVGAGDF